MMMLINTINIKIFKSGCFSNDYIFFSSPSRMSQIEALCLLRTKLILCTEDQEKMNFPTCSTTSMQLCQYCKAATNRMTSILIFIKVWQIDYRHRPWSNEAHITSEDVYSWRGLMPRSSERSN